MRRSRGRTPAGRSKMRAPFACPRVRGGAVCVQGVCQAGGGDQDHDGVLTAMDCNDNDASVGSTSERTCSSGCGTGVSHCTNGTWGACTAPTTCDCTTGEPPRMIACAHCGMQRQVCTAGTWTDDGLCTGSGPCAFGDIDHGGHVRDDVRKRRRASARPTARGARGSA